MSNDPNADNPGEWCAACGHWYHGERPCLAHTESFLEHLQGIYKPCGCVGEREEVDE